MQDSKTNILIWNMQVPVLITLSPPQASVPPLFILVNRVHYIINYLPEIETYFNSFRKEKKETKDHWLEGFGKLVPWNIPFGVFFDLNSRNDLPVEINLKYGDIPKELISQMRGFTVKQHYFWDLKQASCIKFDNDASNILMSLPARDYDLLWSSFEKNNRMEFIEIFRKCMDGKDRKKAPKVLPVRVYFEGNRRVQRGLAFDSAQKTLKDGLGEVFGSSNLDQFKVIAHGVTLPLSTPLEFLYNEFYSYDGFVYLVLKGEPKPGY